MVAMRGRLTRFSRWRRLQRRARPSEPLILNCPSFWRGRRVFLTGHTGFKGAWLTLWLAELGAEVTGFGLPPEHASSLAARINLDARCRSVLADLRDLDALRAAMTAAAPEVVFHLAAQSLVRRSYRDPVATFATNVMGTVHCLEALRAVPSARAAVIVTSDKCYENRGPGQAYLESDPMGGHDPYSASKACAELAAAAYRSSFFHGDAACRIATARAGNVIGGGDTAEDRLVPDAVAAFAAGRSLEIRAPSATRPWQHVLESLQGYLLLAERLAGARGASYAEAWNFGPPEAACQPVSAIVDRLAARWGGGAAWHLSDRLHPHEAASLAIDATKARQRLGWLPRLPLDTALDWTVDWHRAALDGQEPAAICSTQLEHYGALPGLA